MYSIMYTSLCIIIQYYDFKSTHFGVYLKIKNKLNLRNCVKQ